MKSKQRGVVLLLILTMSSILIMLATNYTLTNSQNNFAVSMQNEVKQARYTALSGISYAMFAMQLEDEVLRWKPSDKPYHFSMPSGDIYVKIIAESGRVDINRASVDMLTRLFMYAGLSEDDANVLAKNVDHWRKPSASDMSSETLGGITDEDYISDGLSPPAHRDFYTIEELGQVYGMTASVYLQIEDMITVYGQSQVNALFASREVLLALGMLDSDIDLILSEREAFFYADGDRPVITSISDNIQFFSISEQSSYYRILSYAELFSGNSAASYAIIRRINDNGQYRQLQGGPVLGDDFEEFKNTVLSSY